MTSDDLVERLRDHEISRHHGGCQDCYGCLMDDAADAIEHLTERCSGIERENEEWRARALQQQSLYITANRDIERLRNQLAMAQADRRNVVETKRITDARLRVALIALQKIYDDSTEDSISEIAGLAFEEATHERPRNSSPLPDDKRASEDGWRPIETAPRDGTHILACRIPVGIRVTNLTNPPTVVHWFDDPDEPGFYTSVNERAPEHPYNPTHWKPLDPLPTPSREPRPAGGGETSPPSTRDGLAVRMKTQQTGEIKNMPMTFGEFSQANRERCESPQGFNHPLSGWSTSDWMTAMVGEVGEAANVVKKLNRYRDGVPGNKQTADELRDQLRKELGDVFVYLDLMCQSLGFHISDAAADVFNAKSAEIGYPKIL